MTFCCRVHSKLEFGAVSISPMPPPRSLWREAWRNATEFIPSAIVTAEPALSARQLFSKMFNTGWKTIANGQGSDA